MRLVNLAHGDLIVLASYLILVLFAMLGLPIALAVALAAIVMFGVGYALQRIVLNRTLGADILPPLLVTFGLSIILQNGLLEAFSADSQRLKIGALESASIRLGGGIAVGAMPLLTFATAIAVVLALNLLSYRTRLGRAFRATSDDPEIAQIMGIDNRHTYALAMGLALAVAALAAFFIGTRANFDPTIGPARLLYAFEAVIIGGLGSLWGTLAGGIVLGVAQSIGASISPEWQLLAGHLAFLVVLAVKPRGLFPRATD
jgi:branched-chain amino acid transport system permease protein